MGNSGNLLTLVKAGYFADDLGRVIGDFHPDIRVLSSVLKNTNQYALFEGGEHPYLFQVSQQVNRVRTPQGYNVLATIVSCSSRQNKGLVDKFEESTGIKLDIGPPKLLVRCMQEVFPLVFEVFEKNPKEAMRVLSEIPGQR